MLFLNKKEEKGKTALLVGCEVGLIGIAWYWMYFLLQQSLQPIMPLVQKIEDSSSFWDSFFSAAEKGMRWTAKALSMEGDAVIAPAIFLTLLSAVLAVLFLIFGKGRVALYGRIAGLLIVPLSCGIPRFRHNADGAMITVYWLTAAVLFICWLMVLLAYVLPAKKEKIEE